jgi:hypothetical protein
MRKFDEMRRELGTYAELVRGEYPLMRLSVDPAAAYFEKDWSTVRGLLPEIDAHMQESGFDAYSVASSYFILGETDKGFEWLERFYANRESSLHYIRIDEELDDDENSIRVRTDPRYLDLVARANELPRISCYTGSQVV